MLTTATEKRTADLVVDAHVHIYPFMSVQALLDAAGRNLFAGANGAPQTRSGVLLVADPEGVRGYARLLGCREAGDIGAWRREQSDARHVTFRKRGGERITAVRGQQLITREGLEVLGIGHDGELSSGLPLGRMVARIRAAGGRSIVAWGVGKWLGRRGRALTSLIIAEAGQPDVMLADNGGRPWCWSRVPQFETAAERGMRVLAGTDPLPLAGEERRIGSYGFRIRARDDRDPAPPQALWRALEAADTPLQIVGRPMPVSGFVANQLKLRLRRRPAGCVAA